ncbi:hypothetical protein CGJ15_26570, partial [Vibrio parahaemolyticus]
MSRSKKIPSNYFKLVHPVIIILHTALLGFLLVTYFKPSIFASKHFGPIADYATLIGTEYKFPLKFGLLILLAVHIL